MGQTQRVSGVATSIRRDQDGYTCVRYHQTDVVRFKDESIILNTGGWFTATTKVRMNQASNQFGLGFHVYQKSHEWFVRMEDGRVLRMTDGIDLCRQSSGIFASHATTK